MLPQQFDKNRKNVCIQGLGFVGAAMALVVANAKDNAGNPKYNVIGVDVPTEAGKRRVEQINQGKFPFENTDKELQKAQENTNANKNLWATTDSEYYKYADVVIVDINLDIYYTEDRKPYLDLKLFKEAMHTLGRQIQGGTLVIVETTVPPGTCEKVVYPILKEEFERRGIPKEEIHVAHSYERVTPGSNYYNSIVNFWRVYSGLDERSADMCKSFLESILNVDKYPLTRLEKTTSTEIAKVLENSYRATTIAFMEEWGRFAEAVGVDLFEVVDAIRMRPTHSNMRQPGFGVGGYCLTKDPYFAQLASKDIFGLEDMDFTFCRQAVEINNKMPLVSLDKVETLLGGNLSGKNILLLGVSYRQDVGDTRYSPSEIFVREALARGARVACQDPLVQYWEEMDMEVSVDIPAFEGYDAIVFAVPHAQYQAIDFDDVKISQDTLIFDANCVLTKEQRYSISTRDNVTFKSIGR